MTFVQAGDLLLRYDLEGRDEAPLVVLAHSLGADASLWDPQMPALLSGSACSATTSGDTGGQRSPAGPYTDPLLGRDVVLLLDALGVSRAHYCGLSIGGLVGMWLGAHAPERIDRLVLCNTAARIGTAERWNERIATVRERGMSAVAATVIERWFTSEFRRSRPRSWLGPGRCSNARRPRATPPPARPSATRTSAPTSRRSGRPHSSSPERRTRPRRRPTVACSRARSREPATSSCPPRTCPTWRRRRPSPPRSWRS